MECQMDTCEKLFVRLSLYWRSAMIGLLAMLSIGGGVFAWTWAEWKQDQTMQDKKIDELQAAYNDVSFIRIQADEILANQKLIIRYVTGKK